MLRFRQSGNSMLRNRAAVCCITLLSLVLFSTPSEGRWLTQDTHAVFLPAVMKSRLAPSATTSYYMAIATTERSAELLGCAAAVEMQQKMIAKGFVVLFFGKPARYQDYLNDPIPSNGE